MSSYLPYTAECLMGKSSFVESKVTKHKQKKKMGHKKTSKTKTGEFDNNKKTWGFLTRVNKTTTSKQ